MAADGILDQHMQCAGQIRRRFQHIGELLQLISHDGVEHDVAAGDRCAAAQHTELKLIASERKGRSAVAVGRVFLKLRQDMRADLHDLFGLAIIRAVLLDGLQDLRELIAQEHGDDGRRAPHWRPDDDRFQPLPR